MTYLHYEADLDRGDDIEVTLDGQANVRLLDAANFDRYRCGQRHTYHGGLATRSPARVAAPHAGHWHVVVDLGGYPGSVRASFRPLKKAHV